MQIEDIPFSSLEASAWNRLADSAGARSPFCRAEWLRFVAAAFPGRRVRVRLALEAGKIVGGLPYVEQGTWVCRQSHCLPWGTPAGVLLAPGADSGVAPALLRSWAENLIRQARPWRLALTFPDDSPPGLEYLEKAPFKPIQQTVYRIELEQGISFARWEASLKPAVRKQNRQARERGAVFEPVRSPALAPEIYRLARLNAGRHGRAPLFSESFYRLLLDPGGPLAEAPGLVRVFLVRANGAPAAYTVCLAQAGCLWLWDGGADEAAFEARPNNLMYTSLVELAITEGFSALDLGAAPEGAESLAFFKENFGGRPYPRLSAVASSGFFRFGAALRDLCHRRIGNWK